MSNDFCIDFFISAIQDVSNFHVCFFLVFFIVHTTGILSLLRRIGLDDKTGRLTQSTFVWTIDLPMCFETRIQYSMIMILWKTVWSTDVMFCGSVVCWNVDGWTEGWVSTNMQPTMCQLQYCMYVCTRWSSSSTPINYFSFIGLEWIEFTILPIRCCCCYCCCLHCHPRTTDIEWCTFLLQ